MARIGSRTAPISRGAFVFFPGPPATGFLAGVADRIGSR